MSDEVTPDIWFDKLTQILEASDNISVLFKSHPDLLELSFDGAINTIELFSTVSDEIENRTELLYRSDRDALQLRFADNMKRDQIYHQDLIEKMLSEDIPVKEGFEVDYTMYPNYISVKSPRKEPIQLFNTLKTPYWCLAGMYKKDSMYVHQYKQEETQEAIKTEKNKFKKYRLREILFTLTLTCPNCAEQSVRYNVNNSLWSCSACKSDSEPIPIEELEQNIEPLNERHQIVQKLKKNATRGINNHNLSKFE